MASGSKRAIDFGKRYVSGRSNVRSWSIGSLPAAGDRKSGPQKIGFLQGAQERLWEVNSLVPSKFCQTMENAIGCHLIGLMLV